MIVAVDVQYADQGANAAAVVFESWTSGVAVKEHFKWIDTVRDYVPGAFYLRELPCLIEVLNTVNAIIETVVIDGYVWLDDAGAKGLGAHLYEALDKDVNVIGVAKTPFKGSSHAAEVLRGTSAVPMYVTSVGMDRETAAECIQSMHGEHRIPTLLKRVDQIARSSLKNHSD